MDFCSEGILKQLSCVNNLQSDDIVKDIDAF